MPFPQSFLPLWIHGPKRGLLLLGLLRGTTLSQRLVHVLALLQHRADLITPDILVCQPIFPFRLDDFPLDAVDDAHGYN